MWSRLPPLLLLLALLAASAADSVNDLDRCVLGECRTPADTGGATVAPVDGARDVTADGAGVALQKRSAEKASTEAIEQGEGSGFVELGLAAVTVSPVGTTAEESEQTTVSAAAEELEVTTVRTEPEPGSVAGDGDKDRSSPPPMAGGELQESPEGDSDSSGGEGSGEGGGEGEDGAGSIQTDEMDWQTDHCTCDLTVAECDADCCCDPDCTAKDRLAFSACLKRPPVTPDRRYCLQLDVIFSNNTEHRLERVEGGLFCIVRDNLVSRNSFPAVEPVSSSVDYDRLLSGSGRRRRYGWTAGPPPPPPWPPTAGHYRSGDLMWTVAGGRLQRWAVRWRGPVSAGLCDAVRPVRFLRPVRTDCWLPADPARLQPLDGRSLYRDICLLTAPPTDPLHDVGDVECGGSGRQEPAAAGGSTERPPVSAVPVVPYLCDAHHGNCTQVSSVPSPRVSSGRVLDALLSVLLVVEQRAGVLTSVRAELVLGAAPLGSSVRQRRQIEFRRPGAPPPVQRSGNPGYQRHLPLLAAEMVTNSSGEDPPRRVPAAPARPILLPSPGRGGGCSSDTHHWRPLVFGVDASISCRLEAVSGDCTALQRRIMETLLAGLPAAVPHTAVAAFGSAAPDGDWVPLLAGLPELSPETTEHGCGSLVAAAEWRVLFAQTGAKWRPQARVVGVRLSFGRRVETGAAPAGGKLAVTVQSSVTFEDVTRRPVPHFAQPPRVDISLPADFFYPFSTGGAAAPGGQGGVSVTLAALMAAGVMLRLAG